MSSITLITPPSVFLLDERVFPSLGILKVASSLENAGWCVSHLDLCGYKNYGKVVAEYAKHEPSRLYAITVTTPQLPAAVEIAAAIRSTRISAKIILGGPHVTMCYAAKRVEVKDGRVGRAHRAVQRIEELFDVLVAGDGEKAIFLAVEHNSPKFIDADGFRDTGVPSRFYLTPEQLNDSAPPARDLIDLDSYHYTIEGMNATSIIAQLGCPFECGFCAGRHSPSFRNIRTRGIDSILEEMVEMYRTYGIRGFMFSDDEQNLQNEQFLDFLARMTKTQRDLGTTWRLRGFLKSQLFNEDQAKAMYEAGYRKILIGFESGSPRILSNIRKRATQEDNTRCVEIAHKHHLEVKALMSVGHPGESWQTINETRQWLLDNKPDDFDVTIITPYPGSPYYDDTISAGETNDGNPRFVYTCKDSFEGTPCDRLYQVELDYRSEMDYYKGDPNALMISHVWTDHLSPKELVHERNRIEREVRGILKIPYYSSADVIDASEINYGHSMGQTPILPSRMFRMS